MFSFSLNSSLETAGDIAGELTVIMMHNYLGIEIKHSSHVEMNRTGDKEEPVYPAKVAFQFDVASIVLLFFFQLAPPRCKK